MIVDYDGTAILMLVNMAAGAGGAPKLKPVALDSPYQLAHRRIPQ